MNFHITKLFIWVMPWLNKVIECSIHECNLNDKNNDISYYLIYLRPFCIGQLCFLDVPVDCMFEQLGDMKYSRTTIDKQRFKLVLNCKYPLESGNKFQPFPIWDDNSVYRMLNMVNTTGMKEIELYIEVVRVKPQVNQSVGGYTDLLVRENDNVAEFDYGCGPTSGPISDTDRCGVYGDDEDFEYEEANDESDEDVDDESNGDLDV